MKSKKRHQSSSEDSENSEDHQSTSSDSESDDSSASEHRYKKKKKRERASSDSDSDSDEGHRRVKKRKHKKKKKKHMKRKRRSESDAHSVSLEEDAISISDGEVSPKKKHKKHLKHKRSHSSSASEIEEVHSERRLHSVVKERRSSDDREHPPASYYQYHRPASPVEEYVDDREREVIRFYRGSSKERRYADQQHYDQRSNGRNPRYEGNHKPPGDYRRPREESYQAREESRGYNHNYNVQYDGAKRRDFEAGRDFRDRRGGPPEPDRFRQREYPERRERYREEPFNLDRSRDVRRDKPPPGRPERMPPPLMRLEDNYRKPERDDRSDRYRERDDRRPDDRRPEDRRPDDRRPDDRRPDDPRPGDERRNDDRRPNDRRPVDERRQERRPDEKRPGDDRRPERTRPEVKSEPKEREKKSRFADADDKEYDWGKEGDKKDGKPQADKEKPNFGLSGKLTADTNTVNGVVIKYTEPDDAKQPKRRWRFYPFKGDKSLPILFIHRQSAFLIGRDKKVCDITLDHPSISKQHAALQYRATPFARQDGSQGRRVRPYIIDLESSNGTFVNNKKIEARRYVELLERDVVKFGFSERDYVLLHENSKDEAQDDDEQPPPTGAAVTTTAQIKAEKRIKTEITEDGD